MSEHTRSDRLADVAKNGQAEEWATITECARRLGLHARQVRRYADRLAGTQDRTPEGQSPLRVRVSSIAALRQTAVENEAPVETGQGRGQDRQDRPLPGVLSEVAFLREQLAEKDRQIAAHQSAEAELRRLLLENERQIAGWQEERQRQALTAATAQETVESERAAPVRPWWQFWRGLKR